MIVRAINLAVIQHKELGKKRSWWPINHFEQAIHGGT